MVCALLASQLLYDSHTGVGAVLGDWLLSRRTDFAVAGNDVAMWMFGATLAIVPFAPALTLVLGERQRETEVAPGRRPESAAMFISNIQHNQRRLLAALGRDRARLRFNEPEALEVLVSMGKQFEPRCRFPVVAEVPADCELPADTLRLVFRIVRELTFNAYQHSHGTTVEVRPRAAGHGLGLIQLFERVEAAGGSDRLGSRNGIDSPIAVVLPVHLGEPALPQE